MIKKFRIHLTYPFCILFFLIQEIFSVKISENSSINPNNDDRIRCGTTCFASIGVASAIIVAGSAFAIFRFQKKRQRQKTGDIEEIVTMKCKQEKRMKVKSRIKLNNNILKP